LPADVLVQQIEVDLQRPGREQPGEAQHLVGVERGRRGELRRGERDREQIEVAPAQIGENLRKIGRGVLGLEVGRGESPDRLDNAAL
jgi:hypothetical protein